MTRDDKFKIQRRAAHRGLWCWLEEVPALPLKLLVVVLYLAGAVWVWSKQGVISAQAETIPLLSPVFKAAMLHAAPAYLLVGGVGLVALLLYPFGKRDAADQLQSIGLVNRAGMVPELRRKRRDREYPHVTVWEFRNQGIPLKEWEDNKAAIEAALNLNIIKIKYARGKSRVLLYAVPAYTDLPELIPWQDKYLSPKDFVLVMGESLLKPETVDLNKIPHILIGGSTGSGKSVLLKLLLMQAVRKGAVVCIADFKGGVDFPPVWQEKCRMCFDEAELVPMLEMLTAALESRRELFRNAGCRNIAEYTKATGEQLPRYIFACDEVAELMSKTGRGSKAKNQVEQIEGALSTIARQGRAFGIHLILATQRPDATILTGQIRNNLDCRVCGRADNVLAQIIMDSADAADLVPKDAQGRFLLNDGTVFQVYWFDDAQL